MSTIGITWISGRASSCLMYPGDSVPECPLFHNSWVKEACIFLFCPKFTYISHIRSFIFVPIFYVVFLCGALHRILHPNVSSAPIFGNMFRRIDSYWFQGGCQINSLCFICYPWKPPSILVNWVLMAIFLDHPVIMTQIYSWFYIRKLLEYHWPIFCVFFIICQTAWADL